MTVLLTRVSGVPMLERRMGERRPGYDEYVRLLYDTDSIREHTQIWWSVRPHQAYPTVETRICDGQPEFARSLAVAALSLAVLAGCSKSGAQDGAKLAGGAGGAGGPVAVGVVTLSTQTVALSSSLQGLAIALPAPLNKVADATLPLRFDLLHRSAPDVAHLDPLDGAAVGVGCLQAAQTRVLVVTPAPDGVQRGGDVFV